MNNQNSNTHYIWTVSPIESSDMDLDFFLPVIMNQSTEHMVAQNNVDALFPITINQNQNVDNFKGQGFAESLVSGDGPSKIENAYIENFTFNGNFKSNTEPQYNKDIPEVNVDSIQKKALADLMKSVKMPFIRVERLQTDGSATTKLISEKSYVDTLHPIEEFPDIKSVVNEVKISSKEQWNKCSLCNQAFTTKIVMKNHELTHSKDISSSSFPCLFCDKAFFNSDYLKRHQLKVHNYKETTKPKSVSVKKVPGKREFTADPRNSYKCSFPLCKKVFATPEVCTLHEKVHTGERLFECSFCKQSFGQLEELIKHENTLHRQINCGKKPYVCSLCAMSFLNQTDFRQHQRQHAEPRLYKCSLCDKQFMHLASLQRHTKNNHVDKSDNAAVNVVGL